MALAPFKTWLVSVVVEFASPCGVGPAGRTRAFFLKCNKIYQGTGHAAVGLWDLLPRPLRLRPGRHYSGGRWAGGWCGRVGWATPVGAAVTPFLINGSWVDHLPLPRAGPSRPRAGERVSGGRPAAGLVPVVPKGDPEGRADLPASSTLSSTHTSSGTLRPLALPHFSQPGAPKGPGEGILLAEGAGPACPLLAPSVEGGVCTGPGTHLCPR